MSYEKLYKVIECTEYTIQNKVAIYVCGMQHFPKKQTVLIKNTCLSCIINLVEEKEYCPKYA